MNMWVDIFKGNKIRRMLYNDEWWFSVVDVCGVLTGSVDPGGLLVQIGAAIRSRELYQAKGYSDDWIGKRMRGISISAELTDEWKNRDVGGSLEYAILTAEIAKATFGLTPSE